MEKVDLMREKYWEGFESEVSVCMCVKRTWFWPHMVDKGRIIGLCLFSGICSFSDCCQINHDIIINFR